MNSNILRILPLLIMFLISIAVALGLFNSQTPMDVFNTQNVGKVVEDFQIPSLQNPEPFTPKLFGNGKVTVLNIFASWCVPCVAEHELLMKLAQRVNIYGIAWKDSPQKVFEFLSARGNPFQQIGIDETGVTTVPLALTGVPETFIIDKYGRVVIHYRQPLTPDMIQHLIIPAIEKLNSEDATTN